MGLRRWLGRALLKMATWDAEGVALVTSHSAGRPVFSTWSLERAIQNGLNASEWVYACCRRIASGLSSIPWFAEQKVGDDKWERDDEHPLSNLLARPNPWMSRQDLMERLFYHLHLGGNGIWHLELAQGMPINLMPLPPDQIKPMPSGNGLELTGWEYRVGSKKIEIPPEEIAHFMFVDPSTPFWGLAPLRAAMATVETDVEAVRWNKVSLGNRAVADGLFAYKHPLTDEQWREARKQVREQHMGPDNAHTPWVLGADASYTQMSLTPIEMDFLRTRQFNVASICAIFGVPVVLVSAERTTYNNMQTGRRMLWQDTLIPLADDVKDALDLRFVPFWNPESMADASKKTLRVNYDASGVPAMQEIWGEQVKTGRSLWDMGVPLVEVNRRMALGLSEDLPRAELPWGGTKPGDSANQPTDQKTAVPALEAKSGIPPKERNAYYKAFDNDRARWEEQLANAIAEIFATEGASVEAAFRSGGKSAVPSAVDRNRQNWEAYLSTAYSSMIDHFGTLEGRRLLRAMGKMELPDLERKVLERKEDAWTFGLGNEDVRRWIRETVAEKVTLMSATTKDRLAATITQGLAASEGTDQIAERIRASYDEWGGKGDSPIDRSRSYGIARTEAGTAVNYGHHAGAQQVADDTGAEIAKEWISSDDDRVRDSHRGVDGEMRALADKFSNGLLHPNAAGAPADEVCNCRCTVAHIVQNVPSAQAVSA